MKRTGYSYCFTNEQNDDDAFFGMQRATMRKQVSFGNESYSKTFRAQRDATAPLKTSSISNKNRSDGFPARRSSFKGSREY